MIVHVVPPPTCVQEIRVTEQELCLMYSKYRLLIPPSITKATVQAAGIIA